MRTSTDVDDDELIDDLRAGRSEAFAELYRRHHGTARGYARSLLRSEQDADDVVAEAFTSILAAMRNEAGPRDGFRPYLLATVRNHCARRTRQRARRAAVVDHEAGVDVPGPERVIEHHLVTAAFARLQPHWRAVLWMTEVEQREPADVAARTGIDAAGIATTLYRARESFAESYLAQHLDRATTDSCARFGPKLPRYVRGTAGDMTRRQVDAHLARCAECASTVRDLEEVNHALRGQLAPALLVGAAMSSGGAAAGVSAVAASVALGWLTKVAVLAAAAIAVPIALQSGTDRSASGAGSSARTDAAARVTDQRADRAATQPIGGVDVETLAPFDDPTPTAGSVTAPEADDRSAATVPVTAAVASTTASNGMATGSEVASATSTATVPMSVPGEPTDPAATSPTAVTTLVPTIGGTSTASPLPVAVTIAGRPPSAAGGEIGVSTEVGPVAAAATVHVGAAVTPVSVSIVLDASWPDASLPAATGPVATSTTVVTSSTAAPTVCLPSVLVPTLCG